MDGLTASLRSACSHRRWHFANNLNKSVLLPSAGRLGFSLLEDRQMGWLATCGVTGLEHLILEHH
ncbi:hypothetical protein CU280_13115 [Yersinia mollaretii]|nr:hypothetical protein CU280_13115 [Yersinia mollaretii]